MIAKFSKNNNEERKETNKLRSILLDTQKINEKVNSLKPYLNKFNNKEIMFLKHSMTQINTIFATLENNLFEAQTEEIINTFIKNQQPTKPANNSLNIFGKGLLSKAILNK